MIGAKHKAFSWCAGEAARHEDWPGGLLGCAGGFRPPTCKGEHLRIIGGIARPNHSSQRMGFASKNAWAFVRNLRDAKCIRHCSNRISTTFWNRSTKLYFSTWTWTRAQEGDCTNS